jgi:hypothetical protein
MKRCTLGLFLASLALGALTIAVPTYAAPAPRACATAVTAPAPLWLTGGGCNEAFCQSADDCWLSCPDANSVSCSSGVCQYVLPGGGGGGNNCDASYCWDSSQCTCKDGTLRSCINNVCS